MDEAQQHRWTYAAARSTTGQPVGNSWVVLRDGQVIDDVVYVTMQDAGCWHWRTIYSNVNGQVPAQQTRDLKVVLGIVRDAINQVAAL